MFDLKDINYKPDIQELQDYIGNPLFPHLYELLNEEYRALCRIEYSKDSWLRGWNIKFRKSGKSLCVIYPKKSYFTVLVVIGKKEKERTELLLPTLSDEMQRIYHSTKEGLGQRWLMIDLHNEGDLYQDMLKLVFIRSTHDGAGNE